MKVYVFPGQTSEVYDHKGGREVIYTFSEKIFFFEDVPRLSIVVFDLPNLPTSLTISRNDVKQINRQWGYRV